MGEQKEPFAVGNLVRVKSRAGDPNRFGQLAIITGVSGGYGDPDVRDVRYLADGVDDWWFVSQIEEPDDA